MKSGIRYIISLALVFLTIASCNKEESTEPDPSPEPQWPTDDTRVVKSGLNFPWEILWGKDNHIWMTEREGKVSKIDPLNGNTVFSFTIPDVAPQGEGGLLGMVHHPDFLTNGQFFVVYNYDRNGTYTEKVVRYTYNSAGNTAGSPQTIIDNIPAAGIHNGSRLLITSETNPKLFITTGDANDIRLVQDRNTLAGKTLRLNLDGTIPTDNPTAGSPVWTIGHRNPQGMVLANNTLYTSEHGSNIEDEINIIEANRNYGWSNVNGPCNEPDEITFCNQNNVKEPLWSTGNLTIAVSGLDYYNANMIPQWKNSLLLATLKDATLYQFQLSSNGQSIVSGKQYFRGNWGRLRDICVSPAGRVYICTSNGGNNDRLIEIQKPE
ncbi:MAG: PQQ-dependent sugar dehydrogenase [Chitinophagaceae bacterium]|jgi:glucose/arabinose dehydrogenase|nr:PQQ-dependent sugar dehydrogenase [Chitinophagaceae bacterium]